MSEDNKVSEHDQQVLETLQNIEARLTPPARLEIKANDQAALNANVEAIARGTVTVTPADAVTPTYGSNVRQISATDQKALSANLEKIASGDAVVVAAQTG